MWLQRLAQVAAKLTYLCTSYTGPKNVGVEMGSKMVKRNKEQSTVSEVQGIEKPMRRSERGGDEAPPSRYDYEILLNYDPSGTISRNLLELFQTYCY